MGQGSGGDLLGDGQRRPAAVAQLADPDYLLVLSLQQFLIPVRRLCSCVEQMTFRACISAMSRVWRSSGAADVYISNDSVGKEEAKAGLRTWEIVLSR